MKYVHIITFCLLLFATTMISLPVLAESRDIYVGDVVDMTIDANSHTQASIEAAFSAVEIVALKRLGDVYQLSIRTFETGIHKFQLDGQEIVLIVGSTLEVFDQTSVVEETLSPEKGGLVIYWHVLLSMALALALVSGVISLVNIGRKHKKIEKKTPAEQLRSTLQTLPADSQDYLMKLGHCLKGYLGGVYGANLKGMTTSELIQFMEGLALPQNIFEEIVTWMINCDAIKYSSADPDQSAKDVLGEKLLAIVRNIEASSEVAI